MIALPIVGGILARWSTWLVAGLLLALVGGGVVSCRARDAAIAERARRDERIRVDSLRIVALEQELTAARTQLVARTQVTERVIERWREGKTQVVPIPVRDTAGHAVADAAGQPALAVPLHDYRDLERRGDSVAASCSLLARDCTRFRRVADSTIAAKDRQIADLRLGGDPPQHHGLLGTLLRVGLGAAGGYAACRATQ